MKKFRGVKKVFHNMPLPIFEFQLLHLGVIIYTYYVIVDSMIFDDERRRSARFSPA